MSTTWIATQLRFIGKATVESTQPDGNVIVRLADGRRRGLVTPKQMHATKRAALLYAQAPQAGGWSDAAQLGAIH